MIKKVKLTSNIQICNYAMKMFCIRHLTSSVGKVLILYKSSVGKMECKETA